MVPASNRGTPRTFAASTFNSPRIVNRIEVSLTTVKVFVPCASSASLNAGTIVFHWQVKSFAF